MCALSYIFNFLLYFSIYSWESIINQNACFVHFFLWYFYEIFFFIFFGMHYIELDYCWKMYYLTNMFMFYIQIILYTLHIIQIKYIGIVYKWIWITRFILFSLKSSYESIIYMQRYCDHIRNKNKRIKWKTEKANS